MASLRLYTSNASPFCLKITVLLRELKLTNVEFDYSVKAFPTFASTAHSHLAPLGKIPALTVQDSSETAPKVLFGSQVIAQYLDSISPERNALPAPGSFERFEALTLESLADGICEASLNLRYERLERPSELLWKEFVGGQLSKITRAIPLLSKQATLIDPSAEILPLGGIASAIALYYVDRRAPDSKWRDLEGGKALEAWFEKVKQRPSWTETPFVK